MRTVDLAKRYSFDGVVHNAARGSLQPVGKVEIKWLDGLNLRPALDALQALLPTVR